MPGGPAGADERVVVSHLPPRAPGRAGGACLPSYPGPPREVWGLKTDEWPGAERGTGPQIAGLITRLRTYLAPPSS